MIEILILSLIQGIAEFLPVSSSSHLLLASEYLNFDNKSFSIDVSLHIGSFLAVVVFFRKEIIDFYRNKILFLKIIIASLPVMLAGYFFVETNFIYKIRSVELIAWTTIIFGMLLFVSDKFKIEKNINKDFTLKSAIIIGILQILALVPGVSRSGIGITAARLLKFERVSAAKISFLISIPILGAVSLFGIRNIFITENIEFTKLNLISILLSFIFSFVTIKYFLKYLSKFNLNIFVYYRIFLGLILLISAYS